MKNCIDLHTHTLASDGTDTPTELVDLAVAAELAAIAVTDHDTVAGLAEAEAAGRAQGLEVIRGCELSVQSSCGELHLLGLWLPHDVAGLEQALALSRARRNVRNQVILEKLGRLGMPIAYDAVCEEAGGEVIGRPHIAQVMVQQGYVPHVRAAFDGYLRAGAAAYVPKEVIAAAEGAALLAGLGATVSLAHPMLVRAPRAELETVIAALRTHGLDALEAFHAEHSQGDEQYIKALAGRLGLGISGGSDYHGRTKPSVRLGSGRGGMRVGTAVLDALKERRVKAGLPV